MGRRPKVSVGGFSHDPVYTVKVKGEEYRFSQGVKGLKATGHGSRRGDAADRAFAKKTVERHLESGAQGE